MPIGQVELEDLCLDKEGAIARGADKYGQRVLLGNASCPRGALFSSGILAPAGRNYNRLLTGDESAARVKYLDPQDLIDGPWSSGYLCPEECEKMKSVQDRAALQVISKCIKASYLAKVCSGDSEPDWLFQMSQFRSLATQCEVERRIICALQGIYAKAATDANGMYIIHNFVDNPLDGSTTELTNTGINNAMACIQAEEPDMFIVAHQVGKKLKSQGYVAICCGANGIIRDQAVTELRGPGGESVFQVSKKLSKLLLIDAASGTYLSIGATRGSFFYGMGSPARDTDSYWGFKRTRVQDIDCGATKVNWFERLVVDPCLWEWLPEAWDCSEEGAPAITAADLKNAENWDYAPMLDPECGADMSKFSFFVHTCSKTAAKAGVTVPTK